MKRPCASTRAGSAAGIFAVLLATSCIGEVGEPGEREPGQAGANGGGSGGKGAQTPPDGKAGDDPGTVALRRLSHYEYDRTIADLLGTKLKASDRFRGQTMAGGFDNVASVQVLTDIDLELYEQAAQDVIAETLQSRRERILSCDPSGEETCARDTLTAFLPRAYRRPVDKAVVDGYVDLFRAARGAGDEFLAALSRPLRAALVSPYFLFRVELDAKPEDKTPHSLDGYETASRLSYFLWSSMPDDGLFAAAARGDLGQNDKLAGQVRRMLDDPRSSALVDNFTGQWLALRQVALMTHVPADVRASMVEELRRFLTAVFKDNRKLGEILTATDTWLDERLAPIYGAAAPASGFAAFDLAGTPRRGLFGKAGFLALAKGQLPAIARGKWILGNLMCQEPPPPPANIPALPLERKPGQTARDVLAEHRKNPVCASCHDLMDPIGLGLENFDWMGRWRDVDNGSPIDARGHLPSGAAFDGPAGMAETLAADPAFVRCAAQKMLTYAVGRVVDAGDAGFIDAILKDVETQGFRMRDMLERVAVSAPFRMRHGAAEP